MPAATHRSNLRPRRRRRDEEGEDEGSIAGDLDDSSVSDDSVASNLEDDADIEGSDVSAEDDIASVVPADVNPRTAGLSTNTPVVATKPNGSKHPGTFKSTADTELMMNGLKISVEAEQQHEEELQFEQTQDQQVAETASATIPHDSAETLAQKSRREHLEYIKERNSNPAFVPNRGGFFLHDNRNTNGGPPYGRPYQRGRGRGTGPGYGAGRGFGPNFEPADKQWAHDLHDTVNKSATTPVVYPTPSSSQIPTAKAASAPPNRTFSVTTVLGNVAVQMSLPDVEEKKTFPSVVKKQYTLLPQHRPPLRRDKPVRISIPDEQPRYIFPSKERSFIFIPRALRPNQQAYPRGRGRGSFQASRRPSVLGGSAYTPSVGMSRKSSISALPSGLHTPTESVMRGAIYGQHMPRPVVRMPVAPMPMSMPISMVQPPYMPMSAYPSPGIVQGPGTPGPAVIHSPPSNLTMHQPQPQKTVPMAGFELSAFKPPQQQQEQPFHQQMPSNVGLQDAQHQSTTASTPGNTGLSHIPEGAIYAQPFQPYPPYQQPGYYNMPYAATPMFYPTSADNMAYGRSMGGPVMAPQYAPGPQSAAQPGMNGQQASVAHESNGMVYYYDTAQYSTEATMPPYANNGMMPPMQYFYPPVAQNVYYPPPQGQ